MTAQTKRLHPQVLGRPTGILSPSAVAIVLLLWAVVPAGSAGAVQIIKGPYLQNVTTGSIVVMWETDIAADSKVEYGLASHGEQSISDPTARVIHEVQLTGLGSDTTYRYRVASGGAVSSEATFATAPAGARSFRFAAYSDTQTQTDKHAAVVQSIIANKPELVIHCGDLTAIGRDYEYWGREFFGPAAAMMRNTPVFPVTGNHEYYFSGTLWFFEFFSLPDNEHWYAYTYSNVRFIALNTNEDFAPGSAQYTWLESELQSAEYNAATWHVAYFHYPVFTAAGLYGDNAEVKQYLVPLFEDYGVDMVFSGHSHAYERYLNNGVYYIVTGGGGGYLDGLDPDTEPPFRQAGGTGHHHCVVDIDVTDNTFKLSAINTAGVLLDTVTLSKSSKATGPSPANGAAQTAIDADLSWTAGVHAVSRDVYFGTDFGAVGSAVPGSAEFKGNQTQTRYDPGVLAPATTYYWAVDERDAQNQVTHGDVWQFTTASLPGQATNPSPADGATGQRTSVRLSWTAGSSSTGYNVYIGRSLLSLALTSRGQRTTTLRPIGLRYNATYYWRVDSTGPGGTTQGNVWRFTTKPRPTDIQDFLVGPGAPLSAALFWLLIMLL